MADGHEPVARPVAFGELVHTLRVRAGLTQEQLAEKAGLAVRTVRFVESGQGRPYKATVRSVVLALGADPSTRTELFAAAAAAAATAGRAGTAVSASPVETASALRTRTSAGSAAESERTVLPRRSVLRRTAWMAAAAAGVAGSLVGAVLWSLVGAVPAADVRSEPSTVDVPPGVSPSTRGCDQYVGSLDAIPVRAADGTVLGTLGLSYSAPCRSAWARFEPADGLPSAQISLTVTTRPTTLSYTVLDDRTQLLPRLPILARSAARGVDGVCGRLAPRGRCRLMDTRVVDLLQAAELRWSTQLKWCPPGLCAAGPMTGVA